VRFERDLDLSERAWLVEGLDCQSGIRSARFHHDDPRRLQVEFESAAFSPVTLVDWIERRGIALVLTNVSKTGIRDDIAAPDAAEARGGRQAVLAAPRPEGMKPNRALFTGRHAAHH